MNIGLYIHIPFCRQKCLYCDFPSYTNLNYLFRDYIAALCREITGLGGIFTNDVIDTVYVGGGTPTLLSAGQISAVMDYVRHSLNLAADAEVSIEANPGTVDHAKLVALMECGINRISFGVQSFSDHLLRKVGRIHTADEAASAVSLAHKAGFKNINIDLMYGLPGQTIQDLRYSIETAATLGVQHLSIYGLKIEEGTPLYELDVHGQIDLPCDETEEEMYDLVTLLAPAKGFERYEISNYAQKGYACRHNLKYWRYQPYIGVGTAAHSFIKGERKANTSNVPQYIELLQRRQDTVNFREKVSLDNAMAEFTFLALRTTNGLEYGEFYGHFKMHFLEKYEQVVKNLEERGLILLRLKGIRLTSLGMKFGNIVFAAFLPDSP